MGRFRDSYEAGKAMSSGGAPVTGAMVKEAATAGRAAGAAAGGSSRYMTQPQVQVPTYEYAIVEYQITGASLDTIRAECDALGSLGWELCERRDMGAGLAHRSDFYFMLFFKRRTS